MLSKEASSTIFWVFGMTRPGIEPRSPGPLANTLTARPMSGIGFVLWYVCTSLTRMKLHKKKVDQNYTKCYALFWISTLQKCSCTSAYLLSDTYSSKMIKTYWTLLRSKEQLKNEAFLWTPTPGHICVCR